MIEKSNSERYLALKAAMMPKDTNKYGTIFGGVLLSHIDLAAEIGARKVILSNGWPDNQLVTIAMDKIEFKEPVFVGDTVSFFTELVRVGNTSIRLRVAVESERDGKTIQVTEAEVTYVAVKNDGSMRLPVPIKG